MTPTEELENAAFQLRNPSHPPGLTVGIDPELGELLAELLEYQARFAALYDSLAGRPSPDPHPDKQTRHVLAVARKILESQP